MISVCIAAFGDRSWYDLAFLRAYPSASQQDAEVIVVYDDEGTVASTRNQAAQQAQGEWLVFLDADDELAPGYIDAMAKAINGQALYLPQTSFVGRGRARPPRFLGDMSLRDGNPMIIGTMVPRDLFLQVGGFTEGVALFEDWMLFAQLWKAGAPVVRVPDAIYRAHMMRRSRNTLARGPERNYWHMWIGHQVFPEHYGPTTPAEDARRALSPNYIRLVV